MRPGLGESGLDRSIAAITGQPFELIRRDAQRCQVCYFLRIEAFHFVIRKPDKRLTTRIAARHFRAGADEQRRDQQDRSGGISDRKSVVEGRRVSVTVYLGGGRTIKKKK